MNYELIPELRCDRSDTTNGIGGGLLVYIKEGLDVFTKPDKSSFNQYCIFELMNGDEKIVFYVIYRSPNSTPDNTYKLCDLINNAPAHGFNIFIGDFNLPDIDWTNNCAGRKSCYFLDTVNENFYSQLVDFPTHIKGNILDLVMTNRPDFVNSIEDIGRLGKSDHVILKVKVQAKIKFNVTNQSIPNWNKADIPAMMQDMKNIDWADRFHNKSADQNWKDFCTTVNECVSRHVPHRKRRKKSKPVWMDSKTLKLVKKKNRFWKKAKASNDPDQMIKYKVLQKEAKKAILNCKRRFEKNLAEERNKRAFSSYVKSKTKNQVTVGPLKQNGKLTSNNTDMANILNEFFCSVFSKEDPDTVPIISDMAAESVLTRVQFTGKKILKKIDKLKTSSAPGPDKISVGLLKSLKHEISGPLAMIMQKSMDTSEVPTDWKIANITPIYKKGSKAEAGNYRPVSLTSICCKIMESVIRDDLVEHLTSNKLIHSSQHGFTKNKSCLTNLLDFLETVTDEIDSGSQFDLIYLDFSKAFDVVPTRRLLAKIKAHRVDGKVLKWMENWLTGRRQRVVLNGDVSEWRDVTSGVPQGSVLGPIAFVIFINDLDLGANMIKLVSKFADDTKLGHNVIDDSHQHQLQAALDALCEWSDLWGMRFNTDKCKVMHVGKKNKESTYTMHGKDLGKVEEEKDIGVIVHKSLKPSRQCQAAYRTAMGVLYQISSAFHYRDRYTFLNLYKTYVRPHVEFASPAWCPWNANDIELLEKVQMKAIGMISGLKGENYESKLKELKIQSLEARRLRFDLIEAYKTVHGLNQLNKDKFFDFVAEKHTRNTRLAEDPLNLRLKSSNTEIRKQFWSQRVVIPWNNLPTEIKHAGSLDSFKQLYDAHLAASN